MVAGQASAYADVSNSVSKDLRLIFPIAAALILLILILMLRSVVAPMYLLLAVGLEFAATLGAAVLVFQHGMHHNGVVFTLPLVLFLFVDGDRTGYNILMSAASPSANTTSPLRSRRSAVTAIRPRRSPRPGPRALRVVQLTDAEQGHERQTDRLRDGSRHPDRVLRRLDPARPARSRPCSARRPGGPVAAGPSPSATSCRSSSRCTKPLSQVPVHRRSPRLQAGRPARPAAGRAVPGKNRTTRGSPNHGEATHLQLG